MSLGIHLCPHGIYACVCACMVICTLRTWGISDFSIKGPGESKLKEAPQGRRVREIWKIAAMQDSS